MAKLKVIEKSTLAQGMGDVLKDLNDITIYHKDSIETLMNKFYAIMRKWGICQGEWTENGSRICANPEWVLCWEYFKNMKILSLDLWLALSTPPKDLLAYGSKPKTRKK